MNRKPISQTEVEKEFDYVRRTFFPQWDRKRLWTVKVEAELCDALGECCFESRSIRILKNLDSFPLRLLMVHEICHAATKDGHVFHESHTWAWRHRMGGAARVAERLSMSKLASQIRWNVGHYADPETDEWVAKYKEARNGYKQRSAALLAARGA